MQKGKQYRIDMRPRVFVRKMRLELIIFGFGLTCALMLPFYLKSISRKRHENRQLDLEEAYETAFGQTSRPKSQGGVVRIDNRMNKEVTDRFDDHGMDDFMQEVQAANAIAKQQKNEANRYVNFWQNFTKIWVI